MPLLVFVAAATVGWMQLPSETLMAYERYVTATENRIAAEREGRSPLLWLERQSERDRTGLWARLRRGEVVMSSVESREAGKSIPIKDGMVHHWVATVFLPGVSAERVAEFVRDYDDYPKVFAPLMTRSRVLERGADRDVVALRTSVQKAITVIMDGDYVMEYRRLRPGVIMTTTVATNLHQVFDAGRPDERRQPTDETSGYLWRYRMHCVFEERPDGTVDQCEAVTLTRKVPMLISWLVGPLVKGIPRDSLELMMAGARRTLVK